MFDHHYHTTDREEYKSDRLRNIGIDDFVDPNPDDDDVDDSEDDDEKNSEVAEDSRPMKIYSNP